MTFLRYLIVGAWLSLIVSCAPTEASQSAEQSTEPADQVDQRLPQTPLNNGEFRDVLNEFMGLNERLERIASRIKIANADLCGATENDIGISTHTLNDYPNELQDAARHYLNVNENLSVRTVRPKSSAHKAGLRTGDQITEINKTSLSSGPLFADKATAGPIAKAVFHSVLDRLTPTDVAVVDYERGSSTRRAELKVTPKCKLPVTLFYSEDINGHLIEGEVWMTSGLMRTVRDDVRVAYIMAHEIAHALHGHSDTHTPDIELEADRTGLILLARAGYNPASLATFWAEQINLFDGGDTSSASHPDLITRKNNYTATLSLINQAGQDDETLKRLFFQ